LVKPFIGENLTLQTTDATRFLLRNPGAAATPITFADLAVGLWLYPREIKDLILLWYTLVSASVNG